MDNYNANSATNDMVAPLGHGRWVPIDEQQLGFPLPNLPNNQPMVGPDGAIYAKGDSAPEYNKVNNSGNAVAKPSEIVQMPPIVQPIALVPYTSQNQPLLQYDPYSRPVEPQGAPKAPVYVKKPYRGISLIALILSILGILLLLFLSLAAFAENDYRQAFKMNGLDFMKGIGDVLGMGSGDSGYSQLIANKASLDAFSKFVVYALPFMVAIIFVLFVILIIMYIIKLIKKQSPRGFSWLAFVILILSLAFVGFLLGMSNGEAESGHRTENIANFFLAGTGASPVMWKWGILGVIIISLVLLIIPFFAKKNAYMIEKDDPSKKTYIIDGQ